MPPGIYTSLVLWDLWERSQFLGQHLHPKLDYWMDASTLFLPRDNPGLGSFLPLIPHWALDKDYGKGVCASVKCHFFFPLSGPWLGTLFCQHSDSGKANTSPSGSFLKSLHIKCMFQSSLSLRREKPGLGIFPSITMLCWCEELWWVSDIHFSSSFDVAGSMPLWNAGDSYLAFGFLIKGIVPCIDVELVSPWRENIWCFLFCPLADVIWFQSF